MSKLNKITSFLKAVNWMHNSFILCNNIYKIDTCFEFPSSVYNENTEEWDEIYQYFLTDCNERDVCFLQQHFEGLHFGYSNLLKMYVLCVTHYGTSWDYVPISVIDDNICDSIYEGIPDCL